MTTQKMLGIWMDHTTAHLIAYQPEEAGNTEIAADDATQTKADAAGRGEHQMHNKEQQQQGEFYKKLGAEIINYDKVVLFGPTNAKDELFNLLTADRHFEKVKIQVQHADKMTDNQRHAFVRAFYSGSH
jgi:stalled ribosome rescue protein Dom34